MTTVLLAKELPGSAGGFQWAKGGDDGAVEVDVRFATELLAIPDSDFYQVSPKAKPAKAEKPVKPEKPKEEKPEPPLVENNDLSEALKTASVTKKNVKPKE